MWKYYNPVEVVFGTGKLDELGQLMAERGLDRALIVSDPFTHRSGVAARLKECAGGRVLDIISEVEPNPTCDNVDACARRARELGARSIIGLGGGSAMDCAKAAAAAAAMDCTGLELLRGRPVTDALPLIAVPTTAGTGSEVGWGAVLSDHAANAKIAIFGSPMFPRLALVGPNERAKTVLFKILSGEMEPDEGNYKWGLTTSQAYFPKDNSAEFDNDDTIADWLTQYSPEKDVTYVRGFLGRMLFAGEDGVKKVRVLSGGEKVRCMLSKLMISGANVLLLDEPTDHLDMESIDALNRGMIKFPGVMIFSSRDHQIVQTTANRIMEIINGKLIDKITTYDEYLESDEMARKRFTFTVTESEEADD